MDRHEIPALDTLKLGLRDIPWIVIALILLLIAGGIGDRNRG